MPSIRRALLISLSLIGFAPCALAQDVAQEVKKQQVKSEQPPPAASAPRPGLTGKERLGPKWSDEQRIDNCHVPIDKRGTKPRPSACAGAPSS